MSTGLILACVLLLIPVLWGIGAYNRLVAMRQQSRNAFAQIDVQLKRRYDLVPNLVETARAYLKHEHAVLEDVVKARNQAVSAHQAVVANPMNDAAVRQMAGAEGVLSGALGRLVVVAEAYPELKADQTIADLSEELSSTENRIAFARQAFNDHVMGFNTAIEQFPASVIAGLFRFHALELLQSTETPAERQAVAVRF